MTTTTLFLDPRVGASTYRSLIYHLSRKFFVTSAPETTISLSRDKWIAVQATERECRSKVYRWSPAFPVADLIVFHEITD